MSAVFVFIISWMIYGIIVPYGVKMSKIESLPFFAQFLFFICSVFIAVLYGMILVQWVISWIKANFRR